MHKLKQFTPFIKTLGLTEYESRILVVLSKIEKATANDLSEYSAIPITKIYQVLKKLERNGLVDLVECKPKKYNVQDARAIINLLVTNKKNEMDFLTKAADTFLKEIPSVELQRTVTIKQIHPCLEARILKR